MPTKIILIVIDACRPDGLALASTPNLDRLWQAGAYTWTARCVMPSSTLPCHMSMFRGVEPQKHGVTSNTHNPTASAFPSILDIAHEAGLHTAVFHSWEELRDLAAPGSLNLSYYRDVRGDEDTDHVVAQTGAEYIIAEQPDLTLVYFGRPDLVGHNEMWMSPAYLGAIEDTDRAVGAFYARLEGAGIRDRFVTVVLADHGGHDYMHGTDLPEDMTIPWIVQGPGIKRGHALQSPVSIVDTAPTLAHLLGLPQPAAWDGQPVIEALA